MYSNISPYLCCNIPEFQDELHYLEENTFKRIKDYYDKYNVYFEPVNIKWSESDDISRNGYLLRLLLYNIENSCPFFICLLGEQYGVHAEEEGKSAKFLNVQQNPSLKYESSYKPSEHVRKAADKTSELFVPPTRRMNWIERNLTIAQKSGYSYVVNPITQYNSLLDLQIQSALLTESNHEYFRFYYRQPEYLEKKFKDLPKDKRKEELRKHGAENEYCEFKIKDLKTRLARKGLSIKYYQNLEELGNLIFNDYISIIEKIIDKVKVERNKQKTEILVSNRLRTYTLTESLSEIEDSVRYFINVDKNDDYYQKSYKSFTVASEELIKEIEKPESDVGDEYSQILKLRHLNIVKSQSANMSQDHNKSIMLLSGPRGCGKTSFMAYLYDRFIVKKQEILHLFYFLKSNDSIYSVFLDVIKQIRLTYLRKDCTKELNSSLHDKKTIIEQLHASLKLGPVIIFIDGLSELESKNILQIDVWLPTELDLSCKFVLTLNNSSTIHDDIVRTRKFQVTEHNLETFKSDEDYKMFFAKQLKIETAKLISASNKKLFRIPSEKLTPRDQNVQNSIYEKALKVLPDLRTARHSQNPLYCQIIAQELFSFEKDLFELHPLTLQTHHQPHGSSQVNITNDYLDERITSSNGFRRASSLANLPVPVAPVIVFNVYIEEVCTLRELIQKVIKRYILKYSWNNDQTVPVSTENPGWLGDVLCFISLNLNGISKNSVMNLLALRGYVDEYQVSELYWYKFRMLFGQFIAENLNGMITFTHDYFVEAVQSLLLDGFFVDLNIDQVDDTRSLVLTPKKNLSRKQIEIHFYLLMDILTNKITKDDFYQASTIFQVEEHNELCSRYFEHVGELLYNLNMLYDLPNMNKILTNYRVLEILNKNRIENVNLWYKCLEYLKILKPLKFFELSLLNNFTVDLSNVMNFIEREASMENPTMSELDVTESAAQLDNNKDYFSSTNHDELIENEDSRLQLEEHSAVIQQQQEAQKIDNLKNYAYLIDNLVGLKHNPENESVNLVLLNRVALLNDLMLHLNERVFIKTYSMKLSELVNRIISKNYPLSDNEKYLYTKLLDYMSYSYLRHGDYETSLNCLMKSIEIVEDLYHTFAFNNLSLKLKTSKAYYELSNFLSLQYSLMAYILLKFNDIGSAQLLLSKADDFNRENLEHLSSKAKKENSKDQNEGIIRAKISQIENAVNKVPEDDSSYYTAKYFLYLYSALLESQINSHKRANQLFLMALNLSSKWFGANHHHTSKVYHYFGCYLALKDTSFFNPRKSELYLRRALAICEKYKGITLSPFEKSDTIDSNRIDKRNVSAESGRPLLPREDSDVLYDTDLKSHYINEKLDNEELNSISTILYDLACLLSVNKNEILRKEGIASMRRCLDMKILMLGANHVECQIIKSQLTNIEIKNNSFTNDDFFQKKQNSKSNLIRSSVIFERAKTAANITPRDKTLRSLENLRKQIRNEDVNAKLSNWITRNSLIERIKPFRDKEERSTNDMFLTSEYIVGSNFKTESMRLSSSKGRLLSSRIPSSHSATGKRHTSNSYGPHENKCYMPTAFSVDIHNTTSVHGPNSSVRAILADSLKDKTIHKPHSAILKPIYYKSVWYDRPQGSSKRRFKQFQFKSPSPNQKMLSAQMPTNSSQ